MSKVTLSNIVRKTVGGGTPDRGNVEFWDGDIPWATVKDFKDASHTLAATQESISEKGLKLSATNMVPAGIPIICTRMAVGRIARPSLPVAINQDLRALFIHDDFDTDYVVWAIDSIRNSIENLSIGSTVKGININQLLRFEIFGPPKHEQTKIAEVLSTVDRAIEQTETLIVKQQRIKSGLMQDLLTRGIDKDGNLRSEEIHEFKDSPVGQIPVEWSVRTVAELSTKVTDGDHHTPERSEAGFYLLSARNINNGFIDLADVDYVPLSEYRRMLRRCNPETGDILVSCSGTIGRVCQVPEWLQCVLVRSAALVKFKRERITSRFAEWVMRSSSVQLQILSAQRQAAQPNLFQGEIASLRLPEPPIEEQQSIAEILDSSEAEMNHGRKTLMKLRSLKTALMQDLLTGEKRVTPLLEGDAQEKDESSSDESQGKYGGTCLSRETWR